MRFVHCAVVAGVVVTVAGCATAGPPAPSGPSSAVSGSLGTAAAERTYPGLSPEYRASFRPDHTDLGGRSNAELAQLLPASSSFPPEGRAQPPNVAAEDGSGLGLRGQTAGETKPPQCLYTPFGKNFSRASDGSDWNLYYAASVGYTGPDGSRVTVTVDRQRVGSDVVALTTSWMSTCGTYDRAFPTFANPQVRNQRVTTAFTREQTTSGVQTYRFVASSRSLDDATTGKPLPSGAGVTRVLLARVRSVVFTVEATGKIGYADLDAMLATAIANAEAAPR